MPLGERPPLVTPHLSPSGPSVTSPGPRGRRCQQKKAWSVGAAGEEASSGGSVPFHSRPAPPIHPPSPPSPPAPPTPQTCTLHPKASVSRIRWPPAPVWRGDHPHRGGPPATQAPTRCDRTPRRPWPLLFLLPAPMAAAHTLLHRPPTLNPHTPHAAFRQGGACRGHLASSSDCRAHGACRQRAGQGRKAEGETTKALLAPDRPPILHPAPPTPT